MHSLQTICCFLAFLKNFVIPKAGMLVMINVMRSSDASEASKSVFRRFYPIACVWVRANVDQRQASLQVTCPARTIISKFK